MAGVRVTDIHYRRAEGILARCNDPNNVKYPRYGGRGVKCLIGNTISEVSSVLHTIEGYKEGYQIDRIDNDGNYEVGNLRWVTQSENMQNSSKCKPVEYYEITPTSRSNFKTICKRRGWDFEEFEQLPTGLRQGKKHILYYYKRSVTWKN